MLIEDDCRECVDNNYLLERRLPLDGNYFTLVFGEDRSKQVQENVFKVQDREVALQHKHNAENATMAQAGF